MPTITSAIGAVVFFGELWRGPRSTDTGGSGLAGYNVFRDGSFVQRVTARRRRRGSNTGLAASTTYSYQVSAIDDAGNQSAQSTAVGVTTPSCANQAPHANAGADQTVLTLVAVTFNGSGIDG